MLSSLFGTSFIMSFVVIILLLAFDFWTVKNISGRLLVGLRWWNEISDDGSNQWMFESRPSRVVNQTDSRVFWGALYVAPAVWTLFAVLCVLRLQFSWFLVTLVAIAMSSANLAGYSKCEKDAKNKASGDVMGSVISSLISNRVNSIFAG